MRKRFHFLKWSAAKTILLCVLIAVLLTSVIGTTMAIIAKITQTVNNVFRPAEIEISSWSGNDIINSGTVPAYVRAVVLITWGSATNSKEVLSIAPEENEDYLLTISEGWFKADDGFYYFSEPLAAARSITLIESVEQINEMEGHILNIQVISAAIQTDPAEAVESSWPAIDVAQDGTLVKVN